MRFLTVTGPAGFGGLTGGSDTRGPPGVGPRTGSYTFGGEAGEQLLGAFGGHHQVDTRFQVAAGRRQPPQTAGAVDPGSRSGTRVERSHKALEVE